MLAFYYYSILSSQQGNNHLTIRIKDYLRLAYTQYRPLPGAGLKGDAPTGLQQICEIVTFLDGYLKKNLKIRLYAHIPLKDTLQCTQQVALLRISTTT